jgi:hypothetical protein
MTPWSTEVRVDGDEIVVVAMLSPDRGPVREFRPFLDIRLDEAHATELLGHLVLSLEQLRQSR